MPDDPAQSEQNLATGEAAASLWGVVTAIWATLEPLLSVLGSVAVPILTEVGNLLKLMADALGAILNATGGVLQSIVGAFTDDFSGADAAFHRAYAAGGRLSNDLGLTEAPPVNVKVNMEVDDARLAQHVANAIMPAVREQTKKRTHARKAADAGAHVARGMGANHR